MGRTGSGAGTMFFGDLNISFDDSVLRPRPWTLLQSDWTVEVGESAPPGRLLELCCGAGQIGLAALGRSGRALLQVDLNPDACALARRNAERGGFGDRVEVRNTDLRSMMGTAERFPIVLADPPYLPSSELARFADDPQLAVDGGSSGLDLLIDCLAVAEAALTDGGTALVQVRGADQLTELLPHVAPTLVLGECRSYGTDRAVAAFHRPASPHPHPHPHPDPSRTEDH